MPNLINRAALYNPTSETWFYLPPFGPLQVEAVPMTARQVYEVPLGGFQEHNRQYGWEIGISGQFVEDSPLAGLIIRDAFYSALIGGDGNAKTLDLQVYDDGSTTTKQVFRNVTLAEDIEFDSPRSARWGSFQFKLHTPTVARYYTVTGDINAPAGPYEAFLYNGDVDNMSSITISRSDRSVVVGFPGTITAATDASNADLQQIALTLDPVKDMQVTGVKIVGAAQYGSVGSTTVRVSDSSYATAGNGIDASAAYNASSGTRATGSLSITAGSTAYVYVTAAANHGYMQIQIDYEES